MNVGVIETSDRTQRRNNPYSMLFTQVENSKRFWWFDCAEVVPAQNSWNMTIEKIENQEHGLVIEGGIPLSSSCNEKDEEIAVTNIHETGNSIRFTVTNPGDGWLMISDVWYPGWDGRN